MSQSDYRLESRSAKARQLTLDVPFHPPHPRRYSPRIALIGCGGIAAEHLKACRAQGYQVVALCDTLRDRAEKRRLEFFPKADAYTDPEAVLSRPDIDVVDVALHPEPRARVIQQALRQGKHVLSQKPFVTNLTLGARLVRLARSRGLKLAVNQNGRWAPYMAWIRQVIQKGLLGQITSIEISIRWDHSWTAGTPFDNVPHLLLYDFGIHWFDAIVSWMPGRKARRVMAAVARCPGQRPRPPLLAHVLIEYPNALVSLQFQGACARDPSERIVVIGTQGLIRGEGPVCAVRRLRLETAAGWCVPRLEGRWFNEGFQGTMGELLCAIEEDREPLNGAAENLQSLALCFAACRAADTGHPQIPGRVRSLA